MTSVSSRCQSAPLGRKPQAGRPRPAGVPTDRPNVLWLVPDQHHPDWFGCAGHTVRTPNVDALAQRGVRFENAVCPSPLCAPSRACLATGRRYDRSPVSGNGEDLPADAATVYGRLRDEAGYHVMGCGKFDLHKASYNWGVDGQHRLDDWGFSAGVDNAGKLDAVLALITDTHPAKLDHSLDWAGGWRRALDEGDLTPRDPYTAYLAEEGLLEQHVEDYIERYSTDTATFPTPLPDRAYCDNWIGRQGLDLLADAPDDRPWFLQVNFNGPHSPWDVTEEMHDWYRDPPLDLGQPVAPGDGTSPEEHVAIRRNYAAMVENVDRWVGRFVDRLRDRGELDQTLVVFAADHGELLGDHGGWGKQSPYRASTGIPFVAAGAGVTTGDPVDAPVSLLDLHATALDAAGLSHDDADGASLRGVLSGGAPPHDVVTAALDDWRLATDGRFVLVEGHDFGDALVDGWSDPVLFDHRTDPAETRDVSDEYPDIVADLSDTHPD
jgi:arylsulfatase